MKTHTCSGSLATDEEVLDLDIQHIYTRFL